MLRTKSFPLINWLQISFSKEFPLIHRAKMLNLSICLILWRMKYKCRGKGLIQIKIQKHNQTRKKDHPFKRTTQFRFNHMPRFQQGWVHSKSWLRMNFQVKLYIWKSNKILSLYQQANQSQETKSLYLVNKESKTTRILFHNQLRILNLLGCLPLTALLNPKKAKVDQRNEMRQLSRLKIS